MACKPYVIQMTNDRVKGREGNLAAHIFTVSAAMVGVCLTVIGLFRVSDRLRDVDNIGEMLLSIDAAVFLAACFLSYTVLRSRKLGVPAPDRASGRRPVPDWSDGDGDHRCTHLL